MNEPPDIEDLDVPGRVGGGPTTVGVTVVVVTDGVTPYVRETLAALAAQTVVPQSIVVVDVAAEPGQDLPAFVEETLTASAPPAVLRAPGAATFGAAVRSALETTERTAWVWLLHDDSAPRPDALARLRTAVEIAPSVVLAGCKQLAWSDPTRLLEVGFSTSRFGRRMTGLDDHEVDQGQHDGREDVLAVGLAGALVRRDVWDELGGPDPALGPYGDGLDLSRRARLAGHRVVVVPGAAVVHAQASLGLDGHSRPGWDALRSTRARREAYLRNQLVGAPAALVPIVVVLAVLSGLGRAVLRLVLKEPHLVLAELLAPIGVLARPDRIVSARARARRSRRLRRATLRPLEVTWQSVFREQRDRRMADAESRRRRAAPSELEQRELGALRSRRRAGLALVLVGVLALSAVALGSILSRVLAGARLSGGSMADGSASLPELWNAVTSWWIPSGLGRPGPSEPFLAVLVPVAAFVGGTGPAQSLLLLGGLTVAALGAWFAAGAATRSVSVRGWAAAVWTAAPVLLLATGEGRLGAVVAHAALPWLVLGLARALGVARIDAVQSGLVGARREGHEVEAEEVPVELPRTAEASMAAAAGAGLAFAVVTAGAPALLPAGLLIVLALGLVRHRRRVLWAVVPALVLQGPTVVAATTSAWRALLGEPGVPVSSVAGPAWQQLLGWPSAGSADAWFATLMGTSDSLVWRLVPFVATGVVLALAVLALSLRPPQVRAVRLGWLVAAAGLATAVLVAAVPVTTAPDGLSGADGMRTVVTAAWTGPAASLVLLGLLLAAVLGASGARGMLARATFGWRQVVAGVLVLVAWLGPVALATGWIASVRTDGTSLVLSEGSTIPAAGTQLQISPDRARVLVLSPAADGAVLATLMRDDGVSAVEYARLVGARTLAGDASQPTMVEADDADLELAATAASLAAGVGNGADDAAALGIGGVLVREAAVEDSVAGATDAAVDALVTALDATPGLERVTQTEAGTFWRVGTADGRTTAWARLTEPGADGALLDPVPATAHGVDAIVGPADAAREIVLAERADPGWRAWLDGRPLRAVATTWRQSFELGPEGGRLVIAYRPAGREGWLAAQAIVLVTTVLLAIPVRRRRA